MAIGRHMISHLIQYLSGNIVIITNKIDRFFAYFTATILSTKQLLAYLCCFHLWNFWHFELCWYRFPGAEQILELLYPIDRHRISEDLRWFPDDCWRIRENVENQSRSTLHRELLWSKSLDEEQIDHSSPERISRNCIQTKMSLKYYS